MRHEVNLTAERLRELLSYDPITGVFRWRMRRSNVKAGDEAGRLLTVRGSFKSGDAKVYRYIRIDGAEYMSHRLAWFYVNGSWPLKVLRFKNSDPLDCRMCNIFDTAAPPPGKWDHRSAEGRSAYNKARRAANPAQHKDWDLRKSFGIGLVEYEAKLVAQAGVCACCGQPERVMLRGKLKRLAVDHDHETGAVRDLLCTNCNQTIGHAKEDPDRLRSAIRYLERHRGEQKIIPLRLVKET